MSLSGPRVISGRRKLLKATLVGISDAFQSVAGIGAGTARLAFSIAAMARASFAASGAVAVVFGASLTPQPPGFVASGTAKLLFGASGLGTARKMGFGSANLAFGSAAAGTYTPASTDPVFTAIRVDGWSADYTAPPLSLDPVGSPKLVYVSRQGFDATGTPKAYLEALVATQRVRNPFSAAYSSTAGDYSNAGLIAKGGTGLDPTRVALNDYVYSTDTIVGSATNNSAKTSPKPVANWARKVDKRVLVGTSLPKEWTEIVAAHRNFRNGEEIACVQYFVTDGTTTIGPITVGASQLSDFSGDKNAVVVWRVPADIDVSSLANGDITLRAKVIPWIGGAASILDSNDGTAFSRNFASRTLKKTAQQPYYAYLQAGASGGTVSQTAATAAAAPFPDLSSAMVAARTAMPGNLVDGLIIRLVDGTTITAAAVTFNTYQGSGEVVIEAAPGYTTQPILQFGASANVATMLNWLRLRNLKLVRQGVFTLQAKAAGGHLVIENCALDNGGFSSNLLAGTFHLYVEGLVATNGASLLFAVNTTYEHRLIRGLDYGVINNAVVTPVQVEHWFMIGSICRTVQGSQAPARQADGFFFGFNRWLGLAGNGAPFALGGSGMTAPDVNGAALVQNLFEWVGTASQPALRPSGDSDKGNITHLCDHHNTLAGFGNYGRLNYLYNENPSLLRSHDLGSFVGPIWSSLNSKHDVFVALDGNGSPNPGIAANYVGGWPFMYGVGAIGGMILYLDASSGRAGTGGMFGVANAGLNATTGASATVITAGCDPMWTAPACTTVGPVAGAGGGNYAIGGSSDAKGRVVVSAALRRVAAPLRFDLAGNPRSASAPSAGAYE